VFQEESAVIREEVTQVNLHRHNQICMYPNLKGNGDNDAREIWSSCCSACCTCL